LQKIVIGFDISTSKVGIAILSLDKKILYNNVLIFNKSLTLFERASTLRNFIRSEGIVGSDATIVIEEPLMTTSSGGMAYITALLQRFNGMCSFMLEQDYKVVPIMVNPSTSRTGIGLKFTRKTPKKDKKKTIIDFIKQQFGDSFNYEFTKAGNPKPGTDDRADSLVLALYGIKMLNP
jgi:hypothetical protein